MEAPKKSRFQKMAESYNQYANEPVSELANRKMEELKSMLPDKNIFTGEQPREQQPVLTKKQYDESNMRGSEVMDKVLKASRAETPEMRMKRLQQEKMQKEMDDEALAEMMQNDMLPKAPILPEAEQVNPRKDIYKKMFTK